MEYGEAGVGSRVTEDQHYTAAWRDLRRRMIAMVVLFLAGWPWAAAWFFAPTQRFWLMWAGIPYALGSIAMTVFVTAFRCPRCGHLFTHPWKRSPRAACSHCHLPVNATRNPDPDWRPPLSR